MRKIIVPTGNFFSKEHYSIPEAIDNILQLEVDGIELTFGVKSQLLSFNLTEELKSKLSKFSIIGIHAPVDVQYGNSEEGEKIIGVLKKFYDEFNANYIVFHSHEIKDFSIFNEKAEYNLYIENDRKKYDFDHNELKKVKEKYPNVKIILDTDHSIQYSLDEPKLIADIFGQDIKIVHLSVHYSAKKHQPLHLANQEMLSNFDFIKDLDCPISVELWSPPIEIIKKEIEFVRSNF